MTRVCPVRDAVCPHGLECPYTIDRYTCRIPDTRTTDPSRVGGGTTISTDGPHQITDDRRWLARQLLDSKLSDEEAYGIVAFAPAVKDRRDLAAPSSTAPGVGE